MKTVNKQELENIVLSSLFELNDNNDEFFTWWTNILSPDERQNLTTELTETLAEKLNIEK